MRVLHLFKRYRPELFGGIERTIFEICEGTAALGAECEVLALDPRPADLDGQIGSHKVHYCKLDFEFASTGFSLSMLRYLRELLPRFDLIHYHYPWPFMDMMHVLAPVRLPTIVTYHSDIIRQRYLRACYRPLERHFLNDVGAIVATSPNYLTTSELLDRYKHKVEVIPIGLNVQRYDSPSNERKAYWRSVFGDRFFLFVGVLRYYKGLHILLEAALGAEFPVVIVGAGPIEPALRMQAARSGTDNVHFLGALREEDKVALLDLCTAVVFPSHLRAEAFGVFLVEGAMAGKPLISSEIGTGTSFINIDGETGIVVPPNDAPALRRAMELLWTDGQRAAQFGANARKRFETHFQSQAMCVRYYEQYESLTSRR